MGEIRRATEVGMASVDILRSGLEINPAQIDWLMAQIGGPNMLELGPRGSHKVSKEMVKGSPFGSGGKVSPIKVERGR